MTAGGRSRGKVRGAWLMHMEYTFPRGLRGRVFGKDEVRGGISDIFKLCTQCTAPALTALESSEYTIVLSIRGYFECKPKHSNILSQRWKQ